ncbi:hypothetical protein EJB05_41678, partial [Eragrostis curvula]
MEDHYFMYLVLALVSLLVVLHKRRRSAKAKEHGLRLPPGPWKLPVIGTLHHLAGDLPHRAMRDLARRHGPVMLLRNGEVPTLVVSSREAAREVMKTHDAAFASRPLSATVSALTSGGRDIIFAPYGDHWRQLRKIAITELLSARRVLSFRPIREQEVAAMLRACAEAAASSRPIEMRRRLAALVADTTARAVLGDRCKDRDVFLRELDRSLELSAGFNPADLWPSSWLVARLSSSVRCAEKCRDTVYGVLDGIIKEHLERMDSGGGAGEAEDLLDVLLKIQRNGGLQIPLDMEVINAVIFVSTSNLYFHSIISRTDHSLSPIKQLFTSDYCMPCELDTEEVPNVMHRLVSFVPTEARHGTKDQVVAAATCKPCSAILLHARLALENELV